MTTIARLARLRLVVPLSTRAISSRSHKIRDLEEKVRHCEERYRTDEETIHFLQCQLEDRLMRMRFLSTFKRDHLPGEYGITHADRECIGVGNRLARGADPVRAA